MSVIRWGRYRSYQRYLCKGCCRTFNDRTGTLLHYSRWGFRAFILFIILVMLTHSSINFVSWLFGKAYMSYFRLFKKVLINVANRKGHVKLRGRVELDEIYQKAGLKDRNNSLLVRSMRPPRRRGLGRRGRGTYNEDMVPIFALVERGGRRIFIAARDVKEETVLDIAHSSIEEGSHTYTDNFPSYNVLDRNMYMRGWTILRAST